MSQIKSKNTKPEKIIRKLLWQHGIKNYRIHYKLPGKPDIVFLKNRIAIFIDGCFWHKCPKCFRKPATRTTFWMKKIWNNLNRDRKNEEILKNSKWKIIRVWEHDIKKNPEKTVKKIMRLIQENSNPAV
jgi:DNA mismatch endonuclease (patch repair protein)